jgi:hypothetical protein
MQGLRFILSCGLCAAFAAQAAPQVDVIAKGLSNPRGIAFAPNGQLFVAEAGSGGAGPCFVLADNRNACYGESGALTRVDPSGLAAPVRVISGLPSLAPAGGFGAVGAQGIDFQGAGNGRLVLGFGAEAGARANLPAKAAMLGSVLQVGVGGNWKPGADVASYELANNPVAGGKDSNLNGVAASGNRHWVADAGANAVFEVAANGKISTFAAFPSRLVLAPPFMNLPAGTMIPMQSVPTSVVDGQDGYVYVGELTGFPFPPGAANVYRVPAHGGPPEVFASGFTNIMGLAFDVRHRLYVLQVGNGFAGPGGPPLLPPGRLIRLNADGSRTVIFEGLFYPGGLAIGPDGAAYVTNFGIVPGPMPGGFPDGGQVLRISLD